MSVLCFSPNDRTLEAFSEILAGAGIAVSAVGAQVEALARLERERFDVLIADDDFVGREGEALLDAALHRALLRGSVFLLTARQPEPIGRAWKVLRAPIDAVGLVELVRAALQGSAPDEHTADLRLFVTDSPQSTSALRAVQQLLARCDPSRFRLTIVDVSTPQGAKEAEIDHVFLAPTLALRSPVRAWVVGSLDDPRAIRGLLDLAGLKPATDARARA